MSDEEEVDMELLKRKPRIKCPPNLEAVYDPKTGAFIGRRPIENYEDMVKISPKKEKEEE